MKIGLFLDVDKTLTKTFIQQEFARLIGCEDEYKNIENAFQNKVITSAQFGDSIISAFKKKQFTKEFAVGHFDSIELSTWTDKLLKLNVDKFLISSGPSYYIDELARRYGIPNDNICRSEYIFDSSTSIIKGCHAINDQQKADFVRQRVKKYTISIGIGDHPEFDGPFISQCTVPILTTERDGYLHVSSFSTAVSLIERLAGAQEMADKITSIEIEKLSPAQFMKYLSVKSISTLLALLASVFGVGVWVAKHMSH